MNRYCLFAGAVVVGMLTGQTLLADDSHPQQASTRRTATRPTAAENLPPARWYPPNRTALVEWLDQKALEDHGATSPAAIFDWDNTAVFGDVEETLFQYGLDHLSFRLTPADLRRLIPDTINGVTSLAGDVRLADVSADIQAAFDQLWPLIQRGESAAARALPAHEDFRAKVGWLYEALSATPGIGERYAYTWIASWLAGMSPSQVQDLARTAIDEATAGPIERRVWRAQIPGRAGRLEYSFVHGMRAQPEMQALMRAMRVAGIQVCVVSASPEPVVEAAAVALKYPVDADHIYGARLTLKDGVFSPELVDPAQYPFTYREGKADLIRRVLRVAPIFVAGDSDGDYEMLTGFESLQMRLVMNRNKKGRIRSLYEESFGLSVAPGRPRTLLQGRDENTGTFRPGVETIPLGKSSPAPLH